MNREIKYTKEELPPGAVVRDVPVAYHREGSERFYVAPGRRVIDMPDRTWPATRPEECKNIFWSGEWFGDMALLCTGCGLDAT